MKLSILDFGARRFGQTKSDRLAEIAVEMELADRLGYTRYWLSEHHSASCSWQSPTSVLPKLAEDVVRLRIGTGGILVRLYSPREVVEQYEHLQKELKTGLDLGLCRGVPAHHESSRENGISAGAEESFEKHINDIVTGIRECQGRTPQRTGLTSRTNLWLLGSHTTSMRVASRLGCAFSYSLFHVPRPKRAIIDEYLQSFVPGFSTEPLLNVAIAGFCAESEPEAKRQALSYGSSFVHQPVVGSPKQCAEQLETLADLYGVGEVVFVNLTDRAYHRKMVLASLAEHVGLSLCLADVDRPSTELGR